MSIEPVKIGRRLVGPGHPCYLVAEIGINHNGDLGLAREMIDAAADCGADAVKFQNYKTEDFLSDRTLTYEYISQGERVVESQFEMFKRCELPSGAMADLKRHCDRRGVDCFSTPTGLSGIAELVEAGCPLLKNGSDYLVNLALVRAMAQTGLPTVLSTGMATLAEMDDAVRAFREAGGRDLLVLHCTSAYPTPPADAHLRKITALAAAFGCPVGFSDHCAGLVAALGAVALGACFVEKHFTTDRQLPGPDHRFSSDPDEFRDLAAALRILHESLGQSTLGPTPSEASGRFGFRLSCVAAQAVRAGTVLEERDVAFRRPGEGLPPKALSWIIGRKLRNDLPGGHVFSPNDFA